MFRKFQAIACDPILWSWYIFSAEAVRAHGLGKLLHLPRFQVEFSQQYKIAWKNLIPMQIILEV